MKILLEKGRAIHQCKLDGKVVADPTSIEPTFSKAAVLEIESLSLKKVLLASLDQQILELKQLEKAIEQLVTDCLLVEPQEIVTQWTNICETTKRNFRSFRLLLRFSMSNNSKRK